MRSNDLAAERAPEALVRYPASGASGSGRFSRAIKVKERLWLPPSNDLAAERAPEAFS
ncbi:hypothetical protein MKX79_03275 [Viridibacillus sp. FSL R5-0468]|uniref:hypothetical protein n=1 Tax=Viridibacillus sp. FSL R5-0468 TaxID=2921640 RepID=UPI0030F82F94